jgi:hypothetical protein
MSVDPAYLEELVDSNEFDRLFELVTVEESAQTWCSYQQREHDNDEEFDPDWWAVQLMMDIEQEDRRRELLARIVALAPNDNVLGVAGAGPLEDFWTSTIFRPRTPSCSTSECSGSSNKPRLRRSSERRSQASG